MDSLMQQRMQKTGLSQEQALQVVGVVVEHFTEQAPSPLGKVESLMEIRANAGEPSGLPAGSKSLLWGFSDFLARKR